MRNSNQPYDPTAESGGGGYYQLSFKTGNLAATLAANAPVFSLRWAPVTPSGIVARCQLKFIKIHAITMTAFTTAQVIEFDTFIAKAFPASDSGGTPVLPAAGDQKRQARYADSLFSTGGDIRVATTGALTAGAGRVLEAQPFSSFSFWSGAIGAAMSPPVLEEWNEHHVPMVLEPGQGLVIQNSVLFGAVGAVKLWIDLMWMEEYEANPGW